MMHGQKNIKLLIFLLIFYICTVYLDNIKVYYSPTNLNFNTVFKTITCAFVGE